MVGEEPQNFEGAFGFGRDRQGQGVGFEGTEMRELGDFSALAQEDGFEFAGEVGGREGIIGAEQEVQVVGGVGDADGFAAVADRGESAVFVITPGQDVHGHARVGDQHPVAVSGFVHDALDLGIERPGRVGEHADGSEPVGEIIQFREIHRAHEFFQLLDGPAFLPGGDDLLGLLVPAHRAAGLEHIPVHHLAHRRRDLEFDKGQVVAGAKPEHGLAFEPVQFARDRDHQFVREFFSGRQQGPVQVNADDVFADLAILDAEFGSPRRVVAADFGLGGMDQAGHGPVRIFLEPVTAQGDLAGGEVDRLVVFPDDVLALPGQPLQDVHPAFALPARFVFRAHIQAEIRLAAVRAAPAFLWGKPIISHVRVGHLLPLCYDRKWI